MISDVYQEYTGKALPFKKANNKATEVNIISKTFGDKSAVVARKVKMRSPVQLKSLAKKFIMKPSYLKDVIATAVAKIHFIKTVDEWESKFTVPLKEYILNTGEM